MSRLIGADELRRRLKALATVAEPMGRDWADEAVRQARPRIPVRTGATRKSFRRGVVSKRRASVIAARTAVFLDRGTKPHDIAAHRGGRLVFQGRGGRTIFARKVHHRGSRAHPFAVKAAREAMRRTVKADAFTKAWNAAA